MQWKNQFFILDIIISLTQVASRGRDGISSCCFKAKGVDTKSSETSHTVIDISRKVKKHVPDARALCDGSEHR